jgi:putative transposase
MNRKKYSPEFKAKVVLEALKGEKTINTLASTYEIHPNVIMQWKRQVLNGIKDIFSDRRDKVQIQDKKLQNMLYEEIGRLKMELDWLKKKV